MLRGDIWVVRFDPVEGHEQAGRRPALVLSSDAVNASALGLVTVLPLTTRERHYESRVLVDPPEGGLKERSWVIGEQIRTISKRRLVERWGAVTPRTLERVETIVRYMLGLRA